MAISLAFRMSAEHGILPAFPGPNFFVQGKKQIYICNGDVNVRNSHGIHFDPSLVGSGAPTESEMTTPTNNERLRMHSDRSAKSLAKIAEAAVGRERSWRSHEECIVYKSPSVALRPMVEGLTVKIHMAFLVKHQRPSSLPSERE
jgi:hypothetical protein